MRRITSTEVNSAIVRTVDRAWDYPKAAFALVRRGVIWLWNAIMAAPGVHQVGHVIATILGFRSKTTGRIYAFGAPNRDGVVVALTPGLHVPSGHDPYGPHFTEEDCVLRIDTGECVRDHNPSGPHASTSPRADEDLDWGEGWTP